MHRRNFLKALALGVPGTVATWPTTGWPEGRSSSSVAANAGPSGSPGVSNGIYLNQLGFLTRMPKLATIGSGGKSFVIRSQHNQSIVFRNTLSNPTSDEASGDQVQIADFSAFKIPGLYFLEIDDSKKSAVFRIGDEVYGDALHLTVRSYYGQRCGCNVDLGSGYSHPACHLKGAFHSSSGRAGSYQNPGGWHDAGDYGRYIVNSGISTGTLLWAWELYQRPLVKLNLKIPESGGKIPDFLSEIRWNLEWMLSLQDEDGGVWHKQTSEKFCGFIMPQRDDLVSYIIGTGSTPYKSSGATADLGSAMAIAARCFSSHDDKFAQRCLTAARHAWSWCEHNPDVRFRNPSGISTGEYGDHDCSDELLWAAAELWRTTGEAKYLEAFEIGALSPAGAPKISTPSWSSVQSMACWTYALAGRKGFSEKIRDSIQQNSLQAAESLVEQSARNGYKNTLVSTDYIWGSNGVVGNQSLLLLIANHLHSNRSFVETAAENLHYLLGRNCFGLSWVTQLGSNPFQHPHHRPSAADDIAAPWPGMLSGGPNGHPADPVASMLPKHPPMKMYVDDTGAYSCNEIAINWNAPLVFLLAALNSA